MVEGSQTRTSPRALDEDEPSPAFSGDTDDTELGDGPPLPRPPPTELPQGTVVGRYVVLQRLGAGGMGVVYGAYDPELDRKVALKLLLHDGGGGSARARLLREAQAMGRLSHPNVTAVHDVGVHEDRVFVAMEFIDGKTLRGWVRERERGWDEVLEALVAAGLGLEAAHDSALVHRDFKPDNVMVSDGGARVRVMDFGLARVGEHPESADIEDGAPRGDFGDTHPLTEVGAAPGTPAYMSAEQWEGKSADAASDQFAFCVTAWESLFGGRPFAGTAYAALRDAVQQETITEPREGVDVPAWLRRTIRRGLHADPAKRWPSMRALLDALQRGRAEASRRKLWLVVGVAAAIAAGAWGLHHARLAREDARCLAAGAELESVWSPAARERVTAQLQAAAPEYGAEAAQRVAPRLDAWAAEWREVRTATCRSLDPSLRVRADACLEQRRAAFATLVAMLDQADRSFVYMSTTTATLLAASKPCQDPAYLERQPAVPEHARRQVDEIQATVAEARGLQWAGKADDAVAVLRPAVATADGLGIEYVAIEARLFLATLLEDAGHYEESEALYLDGFQRASKLDAPLLALTAASGMAYLVGDDLRRFGEGEVWLHAAHSALARVEDPDSRLHTDLLGVASAIAADAAEYSKAEAMLQELLRLRTAAHGSSHPEVSATLADIGFVAMGTKNSEAAVVAFERALESFARTIGPQHPHNATVYNNLAYALSNLGRLDEAIAAGRKAVAIAEAARSPGHTDIAMCEATLGMGLLENAQFTEAIALFESSLASFQRALGSEHRHTITVVANLGIAMEATGNLARAAELAEQALAAGERNEEATAEELAGLRARVGRLLTEAEDAGRARTLLSSALAGAGTDASLRSDALVGLAAVERVHGDRTLALQLAEQAWALTEVEPVERANAALELARVLEAIDNPDHARAITVANEGLAALPPGPWPQRKALQAWLQ